MIKGFSTFTVVFLEKYEKENGITEAELIVALSEYFDDLCHLPWYMEYFDGAVFHFLISYGTRYVKSAATSPITAAYQQAVQEISIA
jgi:hypothetical protein